MANLDNIDFRVATGMIEKIIIGESGMLRLSFQNKLVYMEVGGSTASILCSFHNEFIVNSYSYNRNDELVMQGYLSLPENLVVSSETNSNRNIISVYDSDNLTFKDLNPRYITFTAEDFRQPFNPSDIPISSIINGNIRIHDTGSETTVHEDDFVEIEIQSLDRIKLTIDTENEEIKLMIDGKFESVRTGAKNNLHQLKPSVLEYLFKKDELLFILSCVVSLWSILWGIRKFLNV